MKPVVTILIARLPELHHYSKLFSGLDALARRGEIILHFRQGTGDDCPDPSPLTFNLLVSSDPHAAPRRAVIDLADHSELYSTRLLSWCDLYLKRCLYRPEMINLSPDLQQKIQPFGLNYACRTHGSARRILAKFAFGFLKQGRSQLRVLRRYVLMPDLNDFEQQPDTAVDSAVVFQTRVWEPDDFPPGQDESEQINEWRVSLVCALKSAFGERFYGGLVPTPLSLKRYPNDVTRLLSKPKQYIRMSRQKLIAIYSRGLFHSTAFKLPECLAASQCIVAEPIRNELPVPLQSGLNYLPFTDPQQCVDACKRLMQNTELARAMRIANHDYYTRHVEPAAHARMIIDNILAKTN